MKRLALLLVILAALVGGGSSVTADAAIRNQVIDDGGQSSLCGYLNVGAVAYLTTNRLTFTQGGNYYYWTCQYVGDYNSSFLYDDYHHSYFRDPCYQWWLLFSPGCKVGSNSNDTKWPSYAWVLS